jgi:VanZ family protein
VSSPYTHAGWWRAIGWLLLAGLTIGSIVPMPGSPLPVEGGDKIGHVLGWGLVTFWWLQLAADRGIMFSRAAGLFAWSIAIEGIQSVTPWRSGEWADVAANAAGVGLAVILWHTPARHALARIDHVLAARRSSD